MKNNQAQRGGSLTVWQPLELPPRERGSRTIQLPYINPYETIWEYEKSFLAGRIDFLSYLGPCCPLCNRDGCYREILCYWRYAIELFPRFKKKRIPIARFLCRKGQGSFSLLPIQLIPYFQYTVSAVVGTLLLGVQCWQMGQRGFFGASVAVDPDSDVTPWLVVFWLRAVLGGLRRGHSVLRRFCDLSRIRTSEARWEEAAGYFEAFGWKPRRRAPPMLLDLLYRYSRATRQFLFGTPSQMCVSTRS